MHPNWFLKVWPIKISHVNPGFALFVQLTFCEKKMPLNSIEKSGQEYTSMNLAKLSYLTNLDFPETRVSLP